MDFIDSVFNISCHKRFVYACCALCFSHFFPWCVMFLCCADPWLLMKKGKKTHQHIPITVLAVCRTKDAYFMISYKSKLEKVTTGCRWRTKRECFTCTLHKNTLSLWLYGCGVWVADFWFNKSCFCRTRDIQVNLSRKIT